MDALDPLQLDFEEARASYDAVAAGQGMPCPGSNPYPYLTGTRCCSNIVMNVTGPTCRGTSSVCPRPPCTRSTGYGSAEAWANTYAECKSDECRESSLWNAAAARAASFLDYAASTGRAAAVVSGSGQRFGEALASQQATRSLGDAALDKGTRMLTEAADELREVAGPSAAARAERDGAVQQYRDARLSIRSLILRIALWMVVGLAAIVLAHVVTSGTASAAVLVGSASLALFVIAKVMVPSTWRFN